MKTLLLIVCSLVPFVSFAQVDSTAIFKKRVLENIEIDILSSFYAQDGKNASVTGGVGTEELTDLATAINISIPIKDNQILTINGTISAYTSASSSNLNPFPYGDDDDDDDNQNNGPNLPNSLIGTPWAASSGASKQDVWSNITIGYNYYSKDRNSIYNSNLSFSNEYDYISFGGGLGYTKLLNSKNTELSIKTTFYFDQWMPQYPIEIIEYIRRGGDLNSGLFNNNDIYNSNGTPIDKASSTSWQPLNSKLIIDKSRNTYAVSLGFSQILSKTTQVSIFSDITLQSGWLANPMQRVYFADKANYFIGNPSSIPFYTDPKNKDVFQLADDIERLPETRIKIPIGLRLHQYINEVLVLRTFYRYYFDDWGIKSNTFQAELAIKVSQKFTVYPNYRFYVQTAANYFAPFDELISTSQYFTSDYDLSKYHANQLGFGIRYNDIFTKSHLWKFGLKGISLDYNYYKRNTGLNAQIVSLGASLKFDK